MCCPFTHLRKSSITDMPFAIARYFVVFPIFVAVMVHFERWIEASTRHLVETAVTFAVAHLLLAGSADAICAAIHARGGGG